MNGVGLADCCPSLVVEVLPLARRDTVTIPAKRTLVRWSVDEGVAGSLENEIDTGVVDEEIGREPQ